MLDWSLFGCKIQDSKRNPLDVSQSLESAELPDRPDPLELEALEKSLILTTDISEKTYHFSAAVFFWEKLVSSFSSRLYRNCSWLSPLPREDPSLWIAGLQTPPWR